MTEGRVPRRIARGRAIRSNSSRPTRSGGTPNQARRSGISSPIPHAVGALWLFLALLSACSPTKPAGSPPVQAPGVVAPTNPPAAPTAADTILAGLTLDQKIGQLLILEFRYWENNPTEDQTLTKRTRQTMTAVQPGGVILFGENMADAAQVKTFVHDLNATVALPLFVSTDEEGGRVARAGQNTKLGVTLLPSMRTLGKRGPEAVSQAGLQLATELRALGINMNLAPVADLDLAEGNPLGNRSFSADPAIASDLVTKMALAFQTGNVSAVLKHFPGLGSVTLDPHKGLPVIPFNEQLLEERDGRPFRQALAAGVDAVMVGHIELEQPGTDPLPATFDPRLLTGILRQKWHYTGLIMTDALNMKAVRLNWSPNLAAVKAIEAGADLILIPPDPIQTAAALKQAVTSGQLSLDRLNESVRRILEVKLKRGILVETRPAS